MGDHVLRVGGDVGAKLVDTRGELDVLLGDGVQGWLRVLAEVLWGRFLEDVNVVLELCGKLRPETHADSVMVQIKYRDLNRQLHQTPELLVQLNAKQKCKNI